MLDILARMLPVSLETPASFDLPVRLTRPFDRLRAVLAGLPLAKLSEMVGSPSDLMQMVRLQAGFFSFRFILPVLIARQHRVFSILAAGPVGLEAFARRSGMHRQAAATLCRVLESQGFVSRDNQRLFLTPFAKRYLAEDGPSSLAPVVDLLLAYATSFDELSASLHSGETPSSLDVRTDGPATDAMLSAVNTHLLLASRELLARVELPEIRSFIVGSMGVSFSAELMRRHSSARVTYGCLDHLVTRIPGLRQQYGIDSARVDGMHSHSGEPGEDTWGEEAFDLVFLTRKMILDPASRTGERFARKALDVLEPGGAVVFWEAIHPDQGPSPLALALETVFDLGMSPSAPLQTRATFGRTLRDIGYDRVEFIDCMGGSTTFAVAYK
ncbi:MAG: hypothetical protein ACOC9J_00705 [Persicimonas sp.]